MLLQNLDSWPHFVSQRWFQDIGSDLLDVKYVDNFLIAIILGISLILFYLLICLNAKYDTEIYQSFKDKERNDKSGKANSYEKRPFFVYKEISSQITLLKSTWGSINEPSASSSKVTILFMPFCGAMPRDYEKYLNLYEEVFRPCDITVDIIVAQGKFLDFILLSRGKKLSSQITDVIEKYVDASSKIIAHGMSIGNFLHGINLWQDKDFKYRGKLIGQIFDSPVYGGMVKNGGLERIFERVLKRDLSQVYLHCPALIQLMLRFLSLLMTPNTTIYDEMITGFVLNCISSPILTIYSSDDIWIDARNYDKLIEEWKEKRVNVTSVCFETSIHAEHVTQHPKAFKTNFKKFLLSLNL